MTNRRIVITGLAAAAAAFLSSCGTILYPDRAYQKNRGNLDPGIIILDGIGLFFFIIPGLIAFAVDFTTGAIYFPSKYQPGDRERTIFDRYDADADLDRQEIERIVKLKTDRDIDLENDDVRAVELTSLDDFWLAYDQLSSPSMLAIS